MKMIFQFVCDLLNGIGSVVSHMDTTQWGILAAIMVAIGFAALRSRV